MSVPANHGCWHEIAGDDRHCPCARPRNAYTVGYKAHIKAAHLFSISRECPNCEVRLMNNELFYIFQRHSKFMGTRKKNIRWWPLAQGLLFILLLLRCRGRQSMGYGRLLIINTISPIKPGRLPTLKQALCA